MTRRGTGEPKTTEKSYEGATGGGWHPVTLGMLVEELVDAFARWFRSALTRAL